MRSFVLGAFLALAGLMMVAPSAHATEVGTSRRAGFGVALGWPSGLVGKLFLNEQNAVDAGLAFVGGYCHYADQWDYCGDYGHLGLHMDYLWNYNLARGTAKLDWYFGFGGRLWFHSPDSKYSNIALGARVPFGLSLTFANPNFLEVFFELAPVVYLVPAVGTSVEGLLGVRFYF